MRCATATLDNTSNVRCEKPSEPGQRWGEGTETLWQHMAWDELGKTGYRGGGQRDARASQQELHPGRRSTDGFPV